MKYSVLVLTLAALLMNVDVNCLNTTKRYFITIDMTKGKHCATDTTVNMELIRNTLCTAKPPSDPTRPVSCYLEFKVVGEPRVIIVVDVRESIELERRLRLLLRSSAFRYESEPMVEYDKFARSVLGVDPTLAVLEGNTLAHTSEAIWCEFNINFGGKNATEILSIWKREAEVVLQTRSAGTPLEIFKTVGARKVHLLVELDASVFDQILFGTPFNQEIPNTLTTTCKTIVNFKNILIQ